MQPLPLRTPLLSLNATKDQVVKLLAERWPLSAKEVFDGVLRESARDLTYQAVFKCLQELAADKVILKEQGRYQLNRQWIGNLRAFAESLNKKYSANNRSAIGIDAQAQSIKFHFSDYSVMCVSLAELIESKVLTGSGPEIIIGCVRHLHFPIAFRFQDFDLLHRLIKVRKLRAIGVVKCETPWDRWIREQYIMAGTIDEFFCKDLEIEDDFYLDGDSIIHVKMSEDTKKLLDEVYSKVSNLSDLLVQDFKHKYSKRPVSIDVEIIRNKELANVFRSNLAKQFNFEHVLK